MARVPDETVQEAARHEIYFTNLLNCVPHHLILPRTEEEEELETGAARYFKHRKKPIPKDDKKRLAKQGKRARFDANNAKSIAELQQSREKQLREEARATVSDDEDEQDAHMSEGDDDDGTEDDGRESAALGKNGATKRRKGSKAERRSIEELRERIKKKIADFKTKRNLNPNKQKEKRSERGNDNLLRPNKGNKTKGSQAGKAGAEKGDAVATAPQKPQSKIVEDTGDIQMSMLKMASESKKGATGPKAPGSKKRRLKNLLQRAEEKEQRLQELKKANQHERVEQELWKDTIKQAMGTSAMDDKSKLRKALKRVESQKQKSAKKWDKITEDVSTAQRAKQEKRETNLKKRGTGHLGKEAEKAETKRTKRTSGAGFEGKSGSFINKKQ